MEQVSSVMIIGRRWFQKRYGNTYCTATIYINGVLVHKTEREYGYGSYYAQAAADWLHANGYMPERKMYHSGGGEDARRYFTERGIPYEEQVFDVSRERDL